MQTRARYALARVLHYNLFLKSPAENALELRLLLGNLLQAVLFCLERRYLRPVGRCFHLRCATYTIFQNYPAIRHCYILSILSKKGICIFLGNSL